MSNRMRPASRYRLPRMTPIVRQWFLIGLWAALSVGAMAEEELRPGGVRTEVIGTETINIPIGTQAAENADLPRPTRGMREEHVLETWGLPDSRSGPVGEPPISTWRYSAFTVMFESGVVIHSVLTHRPRDLSPVNTTSK